MLLMELTAGGMNKAQTHFTLYAVPHVRMFIGFIFEFDKSNIQCVRKVAVHL
jgi:hypothetical protein